MSQYNINLPLWVNSTQGGIVVPRLTTEQKNGIAATSGMLVYDTTLNDFEFYNGYNWISSGQSYTGPLFSNSQIDAFGRIRTSNPFTLFDSSNRYRLNEKFSTGSTGNGTVTYYPETAITQLAVSGNGDSVVAESYRVFPYQPGKSLLIMCSFIGDNTMSAGLTQRVGYFSTSNGVYFQLSGNQASVNIRNDSVVTSIAQASWNVDPLNGSGPSGITALWNRAQLLFIDLEWLGVGTVQIGFIIDSQFIIVHKFFHANISTSTYMATACLPVRFEISSSSPAGTLKQVCATVISEGGYQGTSMKRFVSLGASVKTITVLQPLLSIRLKSDNLDAIILPAQIDLLPTSSNANIQYQLILNGTISTPTWVSAGSDSSVQYDVSATTITGGRTIDLGFVTSSSQSKNILVLNGIEQFNYQLGRSVAGVSDILSVCAVVLSGSNVNVTAAIGWYEIGMQ